MKSSKDLPSTFLTKSESKEVNLRSTLTCLSQNHYLFWMKFPSAKKPLAVSLEQAMLTNTVPVVPMRRKSPSKAISFFCDKCKMARLNACRVQWSLRILVHTEDKPQQKINLNIYGQQIVQKLFIICEITEIASEDKAVEAIFNTELLKLSCEIQSHKLIDIDPIHI